MRGILRHQANARPGATSWLCRDDFDRERMLDMEERVRPVRQRALAILAVALIAAGPWLGWWPALFLIPAALCFATADLLMPRVARPELLMFCLLYTSPSPRDRTRSRM